MLDSLHCGGGEEGTVCAGFGGVGERDGGRGCLPWTGGRGRMVTYPGIAGECCDVVCGTVIGWCGGRRWVYGVWGASGEVPSEVVV